MLAEVGNTIGRLRVHGAARDSPALRLALGNMLDRIDLEAPGLPPSAMLMVRRLADTLPGRLAPHRGLRVYPDWQQAVREALGDAGRRAARPQRGVLPADADAVVFADEGELLACLALAWSRGETAHRWWWRTLLRGGHATGLAALLRGRATAVPAAFHALARWGRATAIVERLSPVEAKAVLDAVAANHGLDFRLATAEPAADGSRRGSDTETGGVGQARFDVTPETCGDMKSRVGVSPPVDGGLAPTLRRHGRAIDDARAPAPWRRWLADDAVPRHLGRERACLLGVSLLLHVRPAAVRGAAFREDLRRWWQGSAIVAELDRETQSDRDLSRGGRAQGEAAPRRRPSVGDAPGSRRERLRPQERITQDQASDGPVTTPTHRPDRPVATPATALCRRDEASAGAPRPASSGPPAPSAGGAEPENTAAAAVAALPSAEQGVETRLGGVLYLLEAMRRLNLPDCFEHGWRLATEVGAWGVLEASGRALLGEGGAAFAGDPLWPALAELDGRRPGELPGGGFAGDGPRRLPAAWPDPGGATSGAAPDLGPLCAGLGAGLRRWLELATPGLRRWLEDALRGGDPAAEIDLGRDLLCRDGRLYASRTHVDLVMDLDSVTLPVRLAGLDRDPGWRPELARVVLFHFE